MAAVPQISYSRPMKARIWLPALCFALLVGCAGAPLAPKSTTALSEAAANPYCQPLTDADRTVLLLIANPANFPSTTYRKGPRPGKTIETETDCSNFVHQVYERAGLSYAFRTSHTFRDAPEFEEIPEEEARPGDIFWMRGHVGLLDAEGKVISATRVRKRRGPSSISRLDKQSFRKVRGKRVVLRYRCRPEVADGL